MIELRGDAIFVPEDGNEITMVPDGCVIYQPSRDRVHYLNPTAVVVYELCAAGQSVSAIEQFVLDAYSLEEAAGESVRACIASLLGEGLVLPCDPPSPSGH